MNSNRSITVSVMAAMWLSVPAIGGTIGFDPPAIVIDRATGDPVLEIDVYVAETSLQSFDAADFVMGSDDGLNLISFDFNQFHCDFGPCYGPAGIYQSDIQAGIFGLPRAEGILLGTLTVGTDGLPNGTYLLMVDYDRDGISQLSSGSDTDLLYGSANVTIVPEPGCLVLLAGVGASCVRRMRQKAFPGGAR